MAVEEIKLFGEEASQWLWLESPLQWRQAANGFPSTPARPTLQLHATRALVATAREGEREKSD